MASGCNFAAVPGSWACVEDATTAEWNMPPSTAEIAAVMQSAQRPVHRSSEERIANMEQQMSIMMRMMLKLLHQRTNSSSPHLSGMSTPASQGSADSGPVSSARVGPPQVFICPVCNAGPMTEKSFYKHIGKLPFATEHQNCYLQEGHVLLESLEGSHAERVLALCKSLQKLVTPGSLAAHSIGGTGNEVRVAGYLVQLKKRPLGE